MRRIVERAPWGVCTPPNNVHVGGFWQSLTGRSLPLASTEIGRCLSGGYDDDRFQSSGHNRYRLRRLCGVGYGSWEKHGSGVVGVSDDPVGETYWKIKNGIRLSGMPAYGNAMTETQMWQVSLLLSRADKPLPAEAAKSVGR